MSKLAALSVIGPTCLDGQIQLTFERSAPWPDDEVTAFDEMVTIWVEAGARGAFPCSGTKPGETELERLGDAEAAANNLGFLLQAREVDARALQLLRHMVSRVEHAGDASLRHITAVCTQKGPSSRIAYPVIDYDNEEDQYPHALAQPGFSVLWDDDVEGGKSRRVLVEFPARIEGPTIDTFCEHVAPWGKMVEASAFALPLGMPDVLDSVMGMVSQFDAITLEIGIPVYRGTESGFDVLINMLAAYHVREQPLRLVTIE